MPREYKLASRQKTGGGKSGCSSVVERDLAKVDVVSSNLITRSIYFSFAPTATWKTQLCFAGQNS